MSKKRLFSNLLLSFSLICFIYFDYLIYERNKPNRLAFAKNNIQSVESYKISQKVLPKFITIDSQKIKLPIFPSRIENTNWETTDKGVSFLVSSPIPGERGNSILYGHNWSNLLGRLIFVKPGDLIKIGYQDGGEKTFLVYYTATVLPQDTSILDQSEDKRITIYTCTGLFDSKRFVVVAKVN